MKIDFKQLRVTCENARKDVHPMSERYKTTQYYNREGAREYLRTWAADTIPALVDEIEQLRRSIESIAASATIGSSSERMAAALRLVIAESKERLSR